MFTVEKMHETTKRLYEALESLLCVKSVGSTIAAQKLGLSSAQTINNWEERGVSKAGMVKASSICGIRTAWIERGELPMFETSAAGAEPARHHVAESGEQLSFGVSISSALDALEKRLIKLDMQGRERIAPLFESFARSPGAVIKADIGSLLEGRDTVKSHASETPNLQKTG
ncbi:MAG: hypothetical protein ACOYB1_09865 [Limnohabitans sp.]